MNSSLVSTCLKRQAHTRARRHALRLSPTKGRALHIIPEISEEEESTYLSTPSSSRCSSPSSPSPLSAKARRRHGNLKLSDVRVAEDILVYQDDSLPCPASSPPYSPSDLLLDYAESASDKSASSPSPCTPERRSCFHLSLNEMAYEFPQPPLPTPSMPSFDSDDSASSSSTSPTSCSGRLPITPPTSDDEFFAFSPVRPLNINKMRPSCHSKDRDPDLYDMFDISVYASPEPSQLYTSEKEIPLGLDNEPTPSLSDSDISDSEEASSWYAQEFSEILTLSSPMPKLTPIPRPESMSSPLSPNIPTSPTTARKSRRFSRPLQDFPRPSAQLDPAYPARRRSIPNRPPPLPPVPVIPEQFRNQRPPPRMSVPADFDFGEEDQCFEFALPTISSFNDPCCRSFHDLRSSASSTHSEEADVEFDVDVQFELDMDQPMCLPLSLPGSPIDLEADIAHAFEELRARCDTPQPQQGSMVIRGSEMPKDSLASDEETLNTGGRVLRSRWSSSTLSSTFSSERDSHRTPSLSPSSKLRLYFGGSKSKKASTSSRGSKSSVSSSAPTPMTPTTPKTPSKSYRHTRGASRESNNSSDVLLIGYGHLGLGQSDRGLRRRGSTSSCSVAGSDSGCSESSSGSGSGLRRKPIPVEMFLRGT